MKKHFLLIGSLLLSSMVFGQAYQRSMQGLRQQAMGGSGAAIPSDAATVFYNPAGMGQLEDIQVYASMNLLMPRTRYVPTPTGVGSLDAKEENYTPFNVYFVSPLGYKSPLRIGMAVYTPFGHGISWDQNWTGRYLVQSTQLRTTFFQPSLSWQINDQFAIGGGFVYARGYYEHFRAMPYFNENGTESSVEHTGKASGVGYNLGIHIKPSDKVQFGITYRSRVNMNINAGYARFSNIPSSLTGTYANSAFETSLPMPQVATVSVGWNVSENLALQFEANYTGWGAYDSLRYDYAINNNNGNVVLQDYASARRYRNTITLRAGMNYTLKNDRWNIMLGTAYIPSPVTDAILSPEMPDAKHFLATGGLTFKISKRITAMAAAQYTFGEVRTATNLENGFSGKYQTKVLGGGVGITYEFK